MTLMDAGVYDSTPGKKRRTLLIALFCVAGVVAIGVFLTWNMPAERRVNQLFAAIEKQDFPQAFGIWNNDPSWQQHAQEYAADGYSYGRFVSDWGSDSEYGTIKSHKILHATSRYGNSTLLAVEVNGRKAALLTLAVEKHAHAMNFSPFALNLPKPDLAGQIGRSVTVELDPQNADWLVHEVSRRMNALCRAYGAPTARRAGG